MDTPQGSDHFPIIINIFAQEKQTFNYTKRFITKRANWNKFESLTNRFNNQIPVSTNTNKEHSNINKIILNSAYHSIPQTQPPKSQNNVPWWNKKLDDLKVSKNRAWRAFNREMSLSNLIHFKKTNAQLRREIRLSKKSSIHALTTSISTDSKPDMIWSKIRQFCGIHKSTHIHCIQNNNLNTIVSNPEDIATVFSKHWSSQSDDHNFSQAFLDAKRNAYRQNNDEPPKKTADFMEQDIDYLEFSVALNSLKGNTPGNDKINYTMLQQTAKPVKIRIINFFNSILKSFIPQAFKISTIVPIHKPGKDKTIIESYRPISLNPCISKTLDKIISKRLWWFVTSNKLLNSRQVGLKKGKSVTDCLLYVDSLINKAHSEKRHASIISLDFEKAFEKVGLRTIKKPID